MPVACLVQAWGSPLCRGLSRQATHPTIYYVAGDDDEPHVDVATGDGLAASHDPAATDGLGDATMPSDGGVGSGTNAPAKTGLQSTAASAAEASAGSASRSGAHGDGVLLRVVECHLPGPNGELQRVSVELRPGDTPSTVALELMEELSIPRTAQSLHETLDAIGRSLETAGVKPSDLVRV